MTKEELRNMYIKTLKVIKSCRTPEHFKVAGRMKNLFYARTGDCMLTANLHRALQLTRKRTLS